MKLRNIVCFLTVRPTKVFLEFCDELHLHYTVYVCVDDNSYTVPQTKHCRILQINNTICEKAGFKNILGHYNRKYRNKATARDKALYYFYYNLPNIKYIWFIEEDVFIPKVNTLTDIDKKYPDGDLLSRQNTMYKNIDDLSKLYHYDYLVKNNLFNLKFPIYKSMICAIRCSPLLLKCIGEYAEKCGQFYFDELFFNTTAMQNNFSIINPKELKHILYRRNGKKDSPWEKDKIKDTYLYHPFKNINKQQQYRMLL